MLLVKGRPLTICSERTVLSPAGSLLSRAMTTQLAMMVMMMVHSKTVQLTNHVVSLRTGLEGVKRNNEVGPGSATPSFFLPLAGAGAGPPMMSGLDAEAPVATHPQSRPRLWLDEAERF